MKGSVRKRGDKWSYYFTIGVVDGKRKIKEKGGFRTKKEAQTALREAIADFETKGYVTKNTDYTLNEYIEYWYETVAKTYLKQSTLELYDRTIRNHIKDEIGYIKLNSVTPVILQNFFSKKQQEDISISLIRNIKNILNNTLKLAFKQGYIKQNPMLLVELNKRKDKKNEIRVISKDELNIIFDKVKGTKYYIPFFIALQTGMRLGEILGLTWDDIDFENKKLTINKALQFTNEKGLSLETPKTTSSHRTILIPQSLIDELKKWQKVQADILQQHSISGSSSHNFICSHEDGSPLNPKFTSSHVKRLSDRLGINFKFHDFRHTHATMLLEAGANIKVIQQRLGHSDITTTLGVYSHVTSDGEQDAINLFEQRYN